MAAVLAAGTGAVLSHASAAALRGLRPTTRAAVDVTLPDREGGGRPGVTLHRSRRLPDVDRTLCDAIPVTTVARTLLDLAEQISPRQLERAVDEAARLRLLDVSVVESLCARSVGRHGLAPLRGVLAGARGPLPVRSELESRFVAVCDGAKLPPPALNAVVEGYEVDVHWAQRRVVVELDGFGYHASRMAFERDRVRDAELQLAGYRVLRITARRLEREPDAIVAALRTLLASGPP